MNHKNIETESDKGLKVRSKGSKSGKRQSPQQLVSEIKNQILKQDILPYTNEPICHPVDSEPQIKPVSPLVLPQGKKYFRVREVAALLGVRPHLLRHWEAEFSTVRPTKSRSGQRIYRDRDVIALDRIRVLIQQEKLTLREARDRINDERKERTAAEKWHKYSPPTAPASSGNQPTNASSFDLAALQRELRDLLQFCKKSVF
jgi:DNA-binding transcriptional MerR regulator